MPPSLRLADLAAHLGREVRGDGEVLLHGVAPLDSAGEGDLAFLRSARFEESFRRSRASAVIVPDDIDPGDRAVISSPRPDLDFARAVPRLVPACDPLPPRKAEVSVAADAEVADDAILSPGVVVGPRCRVGSGTHIHGNVTLYPDVVIGESCEIHSGVVLREGSVLGDRVRLQPGVVIGGDGFGYVPDEEGRMLHVPHVGRVVIEDDVEIGANTTVDRATLAETRIRRGAKIDNLVQIAHNCDIGEDAVIVAQSGLSGSTVVGPGAILMAQSGSAGHLRVGERAFVGARAGLHKDVPDGGRVWGAPQMEERTWHRSILALGRLPDVLKRLRAVERQLGLRAKRRDEQGG